MLVFPESDRFNSRSEGAADIVVFSGDSLDLKINLI